MGRRRCCCDCYQFEDDFDRDNSTTIGAPWAEYAGDSEIVGQRLHIPENGIVALEVMPAPVGEEVGIFWADVEMWAYDEYLIPSYHIGTKYRILMLVPDGGGAEDYAIEFEVTAVETGKLRLFGPGDVQIGSDKEVNITDQYVRIVACVSKDLIAGGKNSFADLWTCQDEPYALDGRYFALECLGGDGYINWAKFSDHYDHDGACPDCTTACCCPCVEDTADRSWRTLTATIYAEEGEAGEDCTGAGFNGATLELKCTGFDFQCCSWQNPDGDVFELTCNDDGNLYKLQFWMLCQWGNYGCEGYVGYLKWPDGYTNVCCELPDEEPGNPGLQARNVVSDSCNCTVDNVLDDITVTIGPYSLHNTYGVAPPCDEQCRCCKEFYIVITTGPGAPP